MRSKLRGNPIIWIDNQWVYVDDNSPVTSIDKQCSHCKKPNDTVNDYDVCLGKLEGAKNACCGHGCTEDAYFQYENGDTIRGQDAIDKFLILGVKL